MIFTIATSVKAHIEGGSVARKNMIGLITGIGTVYTQHSAAMERPIQ